MKYLLIFFILLVIFIIAITIGAHNDQVITVNYLLAQGEFRVSTVLSVLFGAGFLLGWLICGLFWLRLRVALGRAQRTIKRLQNPLQPVPSSVTPSPTPANKE